MMTASQSQSWKVGIADEDYKLQANYLNTHEEIVS